MGGLHPTCRVAYILHLPSCRVLETPSYIDAHTMYMETRVLEALDGSTPVAYRLFCVLKISHASFRVLNTAPAIILCSVVASVGI